MATGYGAAVPKEYQPYDYKDYYGPGMDTRQKWEAPITPESLAKFRSMLGALGIDQTPVDPNAIGAGDKVRGVLGLAPVMPTATQADVRKSDNAIAAGAVPQSMMDRVAGIFGGGAAPAVTAAAATPVSAPAVPQAGFQSQVRASDNVIAANNQPLVVDGQWAAPHGASPGIGAQLVAGPATTSVSSSRDANGNLVFTNAPPSGAAPVAKGPALYRPVPGGFGAAYAASMNQARAAGQDRAAQETALKLPEIMKHGAEATLLSERVKLAAAETDPAKKAAILAGHIMPERKLEFPLGLQPPLDPKNPVAVAADPYTGKVVTTNIRPAAQATVEQLQAYAKSQGQVMTPEQIRNMAAQQGIRVTN